MEKTKEIDIGGELNDYPNDKYKKFFNQFVEIDALLIKQWKPVHLIAYFCKKYHNHYNIKYQFKFNSPSPSKCFEVFQVKKLAMLLSSDPEILKKYIDWAFDTRVKNSKKRLTSISFMTHEELVNDFKINVLLGNNQGSIDRSTLLPDNVIDIMKEVGEINTYGELAFIWQAHNSSGLDENFTSALLKLSEISFDFSILDKII